MSYKSLHTFKQTKKIYGRVKHVLQDFYFTLKQFNTVGKPLY